MIIPELYRMIGICPENRQNEYRGYPRIFYLVSSVNLVRTVSSICSRSRRVIG